MRQQVGRLMSSAAVTRIGVSSTTWPSGRCVDVRMVGLRLKSTRPTTPARTATATLHPRSLHHQAILGASSSLASVSSCDTGKQSLFQPVLYDSPFDWKKAKDDAGKTVWYRNPDSLGIFMLHWQDRFRNNGDIYAHIDLQLNDSRGNAAAIQPTAKHLREAMRRLRFQHPIVAMAVRQRSDLKVDPITLPATIQHVKLQACLAYPVINSEAGVEDWLDRTIIVHDQEEDFASLFRKLSAVDRPSIDSLRVHFWEADGQHPARLMVEQTHVITDGIGMLTTVDEVVQSLASTLADPNPHVIEWGTEVSRLPPSLQDAIASPPESWEVGKEELKGIEREIRARMAGKAKPSTLDKVLDQVFELTLANNASDSKIRRLLNWPLAKAVRWQAQTGESFSIGLLPNAREPYSGRWTCNDFMEDHFSKDDTSKLLAGLKRNKLTLAPFVEAAMSFATTWVRRQRGLTKCRDEWDDDSKVLGSFSTPTNKRSDLVTDQQRYLGQAMSTFGTKVSARQARWSDESLDEAVASPLDALTVIPHTINDKDMASIIGLAKVLTGQYQAGRKEEDWLKNQQATMFNAMQAEYLVLSDVAYYPSHPGLSSFGPLDGILSSSRPVNIKNASSQGMTLNVSKYRSATRNNSAQLSCNLYSLDGKLTFTIMYADWLYNTNDNGRSTQRHAVDYSKHPNIVPVWYSIVKMIMCSMMEEVDSSLGNSE